jgi:hypothetical protein
VDWSSPPRMGECGQSGKILAEKALEGGRGRGKMGGSRRSGRSGVARGANVGGKFGERRALECLCTRHSSLVRGMWRRQEADTDRPLDGQA